jgi:hypothetical protein
VPITYAVIDGIIWDLDIEEPVLMVSDIDASDKACVEQFLAVVFAMAEDTNESYERDCD